MSWGVKRAERLRYFWESARKWFRARRDKAWAGISILVFRGHGAGQPRRIRINYYSLFFIGLVVLALPLAGSTLYVRSSLQEPDYARIIESRRALISSLRTNIEEKDVLLGFVEVQVNRYHSLAHEDRPSAIGELRRILQRKATEEKPVEAFDYDAELLRRLKGRGDVLLDQAAYHSLNLIWNRMTIYHLQPHGRPVSGGGGLISSGFGYRTDPLNGSRAMHPAIDFTSSRGTPLIATAPGRVVTASRSAGLGNFVRIHHGLGFTSLYAHCDTLAVGKDMWVERGQVVGTMGRTGRVTGTHVHYEIQSSADGQVDPMEYVRLR